MFSIGLFLLLAGDFSEFLDELKRNPPCSLQSIAAPRKTVWSERAGPWLIKERVIQLAPGVAVIAGEVLEVGSTVGIRTRPVQILTVLYSGSWRVHTAQCGPEPLPFTISRLTQ